MAKRAFSLIELLVVISIVSLLIGILLPALRGTRDSARNALCLSTLRQNAITYELFREAHNRAVPRLPVELSTPIDGDPYGLSDPAWQCKGAVAYWRGQIVAMNILVDAQRGHYRGVFSELNPLGVGRMYDQSLWRVASGSTTVTVPCPPILWDAERCFHGGRQIGSTWQGGHMNKVWINGNAKGVKNGPGAFMCCPWAMF